MAIKAGKFSDMMDDPGTSAHAPIVTEHRQLYLVSSVGHRSKIAAYLLLPT